MTAGPLLFARYAYPPNALGFCGADETRTLLDYGSAGESDGGLAELARTFEGAWPYLVLIAHANRIDDPLDPRVVEAYWVGNGLLDRVTPGSLMRHVEDRFSKRIGRSWRHVLDAVAAGAVPHHNFHVLAVYPWLGLLRTGIVDQPLYVLDPAARRRRRWGRCKATTPPSSCARSSGTVARSSSARSSRATCAGATRVPGSSPSSSPTSGCRSTGTSSATASPFAGAARLELETRRTLAAVNSSSASAAALA